MTAPCSSRWRECAARSAAVATAYSVRDGAVTWHPALDVNRIVLGGQLVVVALLFTVRSILNHRRPN